MATRKYGNFDSTDQRFGKETGPSYTVERVESEFGYTTHRQDSLGIGWEGTGENMPPRAKKDETPDAPTGEWIGEREIARREEVTGELMHGDEISQDLLRNINTFADAAAAYMEATGEKPVYIHDSELSDGFTLIETGDKEDLIGVPMILVKWKFINNTDGDYVFASAVVKTGEKPDDIRKIHFTDGSTGIYKELLKFTQLTRKTGGLILPRGLRKSTYDFSPDDRKTLTPREAADYIGAGKKVQKATTYYLDTSAE